MKQLSVAEVAVDDSIWAYLEGNEENVESTNADLGSVRPNRDLFRWKNNVIPYTMSIDFKYKVVIKIINAIKEINSNLEGCIEFREKEDGDIEFVEIRVPTASHCKSTVGKYPGANGERYLEIDEFCPERDIYHELFHTIGMLHEHQRSDRDQYVKFNQNNLRRPSKDKNFKKYTRVDTLGLPYDITSITHYQYNQGAKPGLATLEPVDKKVLTIACLLILMEFNFEKL